MTIAATFRASFRTPGAAFGSRLARLPLVLLLTVGMLLSLIHCAGDALNIASAPATTWPSHRIRAPCPIRINSSCPATAATACPT